MSEVKHTPTPWEVIKGDWEPWDGAIEILSGNYTIAYTTSGGNEEMDAAHIVKCVNMHDELVETLEAIGNLTRATVGTAGRAVNRLNMAIDMANDALKKAGAL